MLCKQEEEIPMTEFEETKLLANKILERPNADPDDDLAMLSRQFLRQVEKNSAKKMFPIQQSTPIPWHLAQRAYDTYAKCFGTSQSLERLAERGGFGLQEFVCLFNGHDPYCCQDQKACRERTDAVGRKITTLEKAVADLKKDLEASLDPMGDLIQANRDQILKMHEEAIQRVRKCLETGVKDLSGFRYGVEKQCKLALKVLDALSLFHPMHTESWQGWPEGS
jgi:hypothetical protein